MEIGSKGIETEAKWGVAMADSRGNAAAVQVTGLHVGRGGREILKDVSLFMPEGSFGCIIGPNGAGKTTLFSVLAGFLTPTAGSAMVLGMDPSRTPPGTLARRIAMVPQETGVPFGFTVEETVFLGRIPFMGLSGRPGPRDRKAVSRAMDICGVGHLRERRVDALSGGERQKVLLGRALAQEPELLLLDEATSGLDIAGRLEVMESLKILNRESNVTVLGIFHDLNLAFSYCSHTCAMAGGKVEASGETSTVMTSSVLSHVFGISLLVRQDDGTAMPQMTVVPSGRVVSSPEVAGLKFHLVAGGGSGIQFMVCLSSAGIRFTCGPLAPGDGDFGLARDLGAGFVEIPPYTAMSVADMEAHKGYIDACDVVVVAPMPVGEVNLPSIEAALQAASTGRRVLADVSVPPVARNFAGPRGREVLEKITSGAGGIVTFTGLPGFMAILRDGLTERS